MKYEKLYIFVFTIYVVYFEYKKSYKKMTVKDHSQFLPENYYKKVSFTKKQLLFVENNLKIGFRIMCYKRKN